MPLGNFSKTQLKNLFRSPATEKYPDAPASFKEGTRGHVINDMDKCVLCTLCQMRCPTGAIKIDKKEQTWSIRPFSCIQCRNCVENCPKRSLSMGVEYTEPGVEKTVLKFDLSDKQKAVLAEQARLAAERAAAAKEAAKAKAAADAAAQKAATDAATQKAATDAAGQKPATDTAAQKTAGDASKQGE